VRKLHFQPLRQFKRPVSRPVKTHQDRQNKNIQPSQKIKRKKSLADIHTFSSKFLKLSNAPHPFYKSFLLFRKFATRLTGRQLPVSGKNA
jgi:hypothetical protein